MYTITATTHKRALESHKSNTLFSSDRMVDKFAGRLTKAVVVDNSENVGEAEDGDDRSMPMHWERYATYAYNYNVSERVCY